jgi:TolB protein
MMRTIGICLFIAVFSSILRAEKINLEIYASRFDSIPIGIVDFKQAAGSPVLAENRPWQVIANDLNLSCHFQVLNRPEFDSAALAAAGAGIYIDGEYSATESGIKITCYVNDAATKEHLFTREYAGDRASIRRQAHAFSNELCDLLFGAPGFFESHVLFIKSDRGKKSIAIMDYDGYNTRSLTDSKTLYLFPAFVDSLSMVFTSYQRGKPDIYRCLIAECKPQVIAASRGIQVSPAVSPIDNTVVYASSKGGSLDIYICNPDGSGARQITVGGGVETAPCWSPNGYQIAYTSDKQGNPNIFVMDADGANQHRITHKSRYCDSPVWSPKGDKIAYLCMSDKGKLDIWTISPDGSDETQVTSMPGHNEYPTWSPDGSLIGFVNRSGGKSDFYVMKPDGSTIKRVTMTGDVTMPDWGK